MKSAMAIRHVHFEDLGSFEPVLRRHGFDVIYLDAHRSRLAEEVERNPPELLVVLGGPIGVYESVVYPFLDEEMALIRAQISRKAPVLGICLGAQLIAGALGAKVYPTGIKEIGWGEIDMSPAGGDSPLAELTAPVLHWHGDTFDLPAEAVHLASTPFCRNQAFSVGPQVLGLQFHAEVVGASIESWLIGHACEIAHAKGVSVEGIRADTRKYAARLESKSRKFLARWLDEAFALLR
jgi:GMP synthase (glutamine-hydrolysing)